MESILVLVDWQNLFKACENRFSLDAVFEEIVTRALARGAIKEIRLFVPNFQTLTSPWKLINSLQLRYGLKAELCPVLREGAEMDERAWKDVVDFYALIWVLEHIPRSNTDLVVFIAGDGDFIVAANEARLMGKEVEFWIVDPDTTSGAIFRNATVRELKISDRGILMGVEENPFLTTLHKASSGIALSGKERSQVNLLRKLSTALPGLEKPVTPEAELDAVIHDVQVLLNIDGGDAKDMLKALLVLGVARIHPTVSHGFAVESSSSLFQWLQTTGK